ncbi:MAG: hypothetical protein H6581_09160 [Bacteroidia bacterium]|nr:hypothetical protein [Bacteroidia bacterium]
MKLKISWLLPALTLVLTFFACNEVDIKLVNQIKTFGPKWTTVGNKLNFVDRNLVQMEARFQKDFNEVKPLLGQISDTLKTGTYYRDITAYEELITQLDSFRVNYDNQKKIYSEAVPSFNEWEKKVMDGDIAEGIATTDLTQFKKTWGDLNADLDSASKEMEAMVATHNRVLRSLTDKLGIYTNYDMEVK